MRQIEDRWRILKRDPPNEAQVISNIINNFNFTSYQNQDINNYKNGLFNAYRLDKCSLVCLSKSNYRECLDVCNTNLIESKRTLDTSLSTFYDKVKEMEKAGLEYFKN